MDPNSSPKFSITIPLFNEEECAENALTELIRSLNERFPNAYELILVINGSTDRTPEICNRLTQIYPAVRAVHAQHNLGYGGGILRGLAVAKGDYIGFVCGDGQIAPDDLCRVMDKISSARYDLVKAVRVSRDDGPSRRLASLAYNALFFILMGTRTRDINAMPKLWRREVMDLLSPVSTDWFIDAEIMVKARYRGLRVSEIPVHYRQRTGGRSVVGISTVIEFLRNAVMVIFNGRLSEWKTRPGAEG